MTVFIVEGVGVGGGGRKGGVLEQKLTASVSGKK